MKANSFVKTLLLNFFILGSFGFLKAQTTINLPEQCDCDTAFLVQDTLLVVGKDTINLSVLDTHLDKVLVSNDYIYYYVNGMVVDSTKISEIIDVGTGSGPPTVSGTEDIGEVYIDYATGDIWTFDGTTWVLQDGGVTTGTGAPAVAGTEDAGDVYVDNSTGDIWTFDGTTWVLQDGGVTTGTGAPAVTGTEDAGDVYVDNSTGDIWTFDGTTWVLQDGGVTTGTGAPAVAGTEDAGDVYVDNSTGDIWTFDGTTWVLQNGGVTTGTGAPAVAGTEDAGDVYVDNSTGDIWTFDGTTWVLQNGGVTTGTGAPAVAGTEDAGDVYVDNSTGDIWTFDGTTWVLQDGGVTTGAGAPAVAGTEDAGDVYVDNSTGDIWTFDGTTWVLQDGGVTTGAGAPSVTGTEDDGDIYIDNVTGDTYSFDALTDTWNLINSGDPQDLYWSAGNDSLLITNGEGVSVEDMGTNIVTTQIFNDSVVSIIYNQGDTLLDNPLFTDSLYSFISDSLLNDVTWLTELSDSIDTDVDSLTLTGSDLTVYEDGVGYTVNLAGLATDPAFSDSLLSNNYYTDSLISIIQDSLLANETFITNLGDTLINNEVFTDSLYGIISDSLLNDVTWLTELSDSIDTDVDSLTLTGSDLTVYEDGVGYTVNLAGLAADPAFSDSLLSNNYYTDSLISIIQDSLLANETFITNLGDTLITNQAFYDSIVSIIYNEGDTLIENDTWVTELIDSLTQNNTYLTELRDSIDQQDLYWSAGNDSLLITNGEGVSVEDLGTNIVTTQIFNDSVVSIIYNQGDTLLSNPLFTDSLYSFISDSLLNDVTWLTELSDSIDTDVDSLTLTGSDLTVYEDGVGYTVNLAGLATDPAFADSLLTNNYFTDSLTSIIQDSLLANETFITNLGDTLITNQAFYDSIVSIIYNEGDTLIENDTWVTELIDSLTQNNTYLTELRDSIDQQDLYWSAGNDSLLITNGEGVSVEDLGTNIVTTQIFNDSVVSIIYNQGDTLLSNPLFTDSLYSFISDSLLSDTAWLTELSDSIDTDVDSLTLTGSDLTVYEDGVGYTVNLAGLATDPAFADSLLTNNYFTDSLTSIIQDSLLANETFITNLGDTLITNQAFYDSIVSIIYNEGDTLIENDTWVTELIDSLTQNNTYLTELRDSIDQQDLYWSAGNDSLLITNGEGVSVEDLGTNIVTTQIFNDSVVSIIYNQGDTLLSNPLFTDSLYSFISDSLLSDTAWLTELSDSIDTDVDSLTLTGSDLTVYEDGVGYTVNLAGLATDPAFSDSLLSNNYYTDSLISIIQDSLLANETFITNLGDTLINNEVFTDSLYGIISDSLLNDVTWLTELSDSIDTDVDSLTLTGSDLTVYEDGVGYTVNLAGLATDPAFSDSLLSNNYYTDSLISIIQDSLLANETFITNLGDTLINNEVFTDSLYGIISDSLLNDVTWLTELSDSIDTDVDSLTLTGSDLTVYEDGVGYTVNLAGLATDPAFSDSLLSNNYYTDSLISIIQDSLLANETFITNLGDTLITNQAFYDSIVSIIYNEGDTLIENDTWVTELIDSLTQNNTYLTELRDSIDQQDLYWSAGNDSLLITNGEGISVEDLGTNIVTTQIFNDSVVSIIYNQGDTLLDNPLFTDSLYSFISDSLLNDVTWLTELSDSIDTDVDSLTLTGSDLTVYEDGVGYTVNLAGLATDPAFADSLLANNYFTDSLTSIIQDSLLANETFITNLGDTLITNQAFYDSIVSIIYNEGDTLIENDTWVTELIDSLTQNNTYLTELRDSIDQQDLYWSAGNDSLLITNGEGISVEDLGTNIVTTQIFNDSVVSIIYNQGDTLLSNPLFTDSLYSFISDSLLNDVTWLTELSDSIDTDVDSLTLTGSDLTVYEDGVGYTVNLAGLATDPAFADSLLSNNYYTDSLISIVQDSLLANETFITNLGDTLITNQAFYDSIVSIIYNEGDTLIENDTWVTELIDSLTQNNTYLTELRDSIDQQDLYWSAGNDSLLITNGEGVSVEDMGTNIVTTQIFNDSVVSIIYNQGDTLLSNPLFTDSLYSFISDSLLNDVTWLTELSDSIDTDVDSLTLTGSDLTVYEDGVGYTVNLAGLATDPAFADSLLTNNYFTDSLTSIIQDSLLANETFITNLGDTLITNQAFYDSIMSIIYNEGDTLIENDTWVTELIDSLTQNNTYLTELRDSIDQQDLYWSAGNDSLLITNGEGISVEDLGTNIVTTQIFNDSVVSIIYNQGDTLLDNPLFTDSLYSFISDSLLNDVTWLTELSDSIDTDVDSLTLTGSDLTVYEDGVGYTVNLAGLATDPAFSDSLLSNNYYTDSLISIIQDSLLANETFITNLGDTLITNQAFYDSIVSIIYNEGDTLIENDTWVTELIDSLTQNNTYLTELRDSIDQQDLYWSTGNDSLLITNGEGISVEDLGTNIVTTQIFNDSVVSIIYNQGDTLLSNPLFTDSLYSFISDSLLNDVTWLTELSDSIDTDVDSLTLTGSDLTVYEDGVGYTVNLAGLAADPAFSDSLLTNNYYTDSLISIIQDSLLANETFITNLGDTLINNEVFTDSLYGIISDSLLNDVTWLTELSDSIDTDVDSLTLTGSDLTVYEDGVGYTVNLAGLAADPAFSDSLLTNSYYTDSLISIIQDSLLANETFITNLGDTLINNEVFTDSLYGIISDSLLNDVTWLTELSDSIDTDVDSLTLTGSDLTVYEDGVGYTVNLAGLATDPAFSDSLLSNNYYTDSLISIIQDSLLANETFITNLGDTLITNQAFYDSIVSIIYNEGDTLIENDTWITELIDSLTQNNTYLTELRDSIDQQDLYWSAGNDSLLITNGEGISVEDLGTNIVTTQIFNDSVVSIIYNQGDTLLDNPLFTDSLYSFISDSLLNDVTWLTELSDSIDTDVDSLTLAGSDLTVYEDGVGYTVNLAGLAADPAFSDSLLSNNYYTDSLISIIQDSLLANETFITNLGDTLINNEAFTDSIYSFVTDSIVNDNIFLSELQDSIDTHLDSVVNNGDTALLFYVDGVLIDTTEIGGPDADWNINANGTGLEAAPAGNNVASGAYALAAGNNSIASGIGSFALGSLDSATGNYSMAIGQENVASIGNSTAIGAYNVADFWFATAIGADNVSSGYSSLAIGNDNQALGWFSVAMNAENKAIGKYSTALNRQTIASGESALATGFITTAIGVNSSSFGNNTLAESYNSAAFGRFNVGGGNSSVWTATDPLFEIGIGTSDVSRANALTVLKNGNVGIGPSNPVATLDVLGNVKISDMASGTAADSIVVWDPADSILKIVDAASIGGTDADWTGAGTGTMIQGDTTDQVVVGSATASPGKALTVAGDLKVTGVVDPTKIIFSDGSPSSFDPATNDAYEIEYDTRNLAFTNSTSDSVLYLANNSNVGIGTSTPSFRLELVGTATTADRKMGINGTQIVYYPDQAVTSGSLVYGDGGNSLNSSSNGNTLMGIGAGVSLTSGIGNTAIGNNALSSDNASIGNTAVGYQALQNNISNYNTALGYQAGMGTSGSTGTYNAFVGSEAGMSTTTGRANVAIGHQAGKGMTTALANTIVGFQSGLAITTGNNNTIVGADVAPNITTGFNNIIVGHNIDAQSATGNNQLSIGNVIFGSGGFGTSTTVGIGNVGIGEPNPAAKLDIQGNVKITGMVSGASTDSIVVWNPADSVLKVVDAASIGGTDADWTGAGTGTMIQGDTTDQVVIGSATASPGKALTVAGDLKVTGVVDPTKIIFSDGSPSSFDPATNDAYEIEFDTRDLRFTNSNTDSVLVITQNGDIGFGTTNPYAQVHIKSGSAGFFLEETWGGTDNEVFFVNFNDFFQIQRRNNDNTFIASPYIFNVKAPQNTIFSTATGNVGIGTSAPQYKLDVIGDIRAIGSVLYGGTNGLPNGTLYTKPDFVFEEGYKVLSTDEVETYLKENGHLPWLTSAKKDLKENNGAIDMTRMSFETVETAENLQLQIIKQQKIIEYLMQELEALKASVTGSKQEE